VWRHDLSVLPAVLVLRVSLAALDLTDPELAARADSDVARQQKEAASRDARDYYRSGFDFQSRASFCASAI